MMTDAKKLEVIGFIIDVQEQNQNDEEYGDKNLASPDYAMEAIGHVLAGTQSGALRQYLEAGIVTIPGEIVP